MTPDQLAALLRRPARAATFGGVTVAMLGAFEVHKRLLPAPARAALLDRYRHTWLTATLRIFGADLTVLPALPAPATRARLVVANHRSALDIGALLWMFGGNIVSRADVATWPLVGTVARTGGTIFVDRGAGSSRVAAARAIRRRLSDGATVVLFPEGTTFSGDDVRSFQAGAFAALRGLDAEVVPVGLAYEPEAEYGDETFLAHLGRTASRRATRVVACVGEAIQPTADTKALASYCRDRVQDLVGRARARLDA